MNYCKLFSAAVFTLSATTAQAQYVTVGPTTSYSISLDNGVVYLNNSLVNGPYCASQRAEIRDQVPYSANYANRLYAALLAAKLAGLAITFVYNTSTGPNFLVTSITIPNQ